MNELTSTDEGSSGLCRRMWTPKWNETFSCKLSCKLMRRQRQPVLPRSERLNSWKPPAALLRISLQVPNKSGEEDEEELDEHEQRSMLLAHKAASEELMRAEAERDQAEREGAPGREHART